MMSAPPPGAPSALHDHATKRKEDVGLLSYFGGAERSIPPLVDVPHELASLILHGGMSPLGAGAAPGGMVPVPGAVPVPVPAAVPVPAGWLSTALFVQGRHAQLRLFPCVFLPAMCVPSVATQIHASPTCLPACLLCTNISPLPCPCCH